MKNTDSVITPLDKMDSQNPQTGISQAELKAAMALAPLQFQHETRGTNPDQQRRLHREYHQGMKRLLQIFEAQQNELINYPDDLPTSFVNVEMEIARCISGCLADVGEQSGCVSQVQALLRDYKAVAFVRGQNPTISLDKIHMILQDNFQDSFLCQLMDLLLCEKLNATSKVITFY